MRENLIIIGFIIFIIFPIAWLWVGAMDKMKEEHPNYKGEDFLNWDGKYNSEWDNNHTENEI